MDFGGNMFCLGIRDQSGNNNSNSYGWDSWEITTSTSSKLINAFHHITATENATTVNNSHEAEGLANSLMFLPQPHNGTGGVNHHYHHHHRQNQPHPYGGDGSQRVHVDPHLMCLKLGKRNYFDTSGAALKGGGGGVKTVSLAATVPRCQVEGCHVALLNAKDYHRRHKVCEMHSKAPKVVVLGLVQRFCQQCSRFFMEKNHIVVDFALRRIAYVGIVLHKNLDISINYKKFEY
ncbi:putative transcription factor SBP family [Lupinus albus]|uniref:Putative transcription factor SBP family n=1 Tax=Lupinus albus TaxID=3870 RepID=A0A6A4QWQ3_LUPAL|nr:putative transcription factor SBP family [Lupinus albus]